jgi:fluoride exporter
VTPLVLAATVTLGALGALLRWWVSRVLPHAPWWSVGIVNVAGSAGIGVLAALPETFWTYPLMVGLAGGLTTFSTLAVLMVPSTMEKVTVKVVAPLTLHVLAGVIACALGFVAVGALI